MPKSKTELASFHHVSELFVKFWFKELSPSEKEILLKWAHLSPQNKDFYDKQTSSHGFWNSLVDRYPGLEKRLPVLNFDIKKELQLLFKSKSLKPAPLKSW